MRLLGKIVAWVQRMYQHYFKKSFFNKIFLVYFLITFVTGQILFFVLSENLISIKYDQALIMSDQVMTLVDSFLKNKITGAISIHQRLYKEKEVWGLLMDELQHPGENKLYAYQQQEIKNTVSNTMHAIDNDFNGLFLGGNLSGRVLQYGITQTSVENRFFRKYMNQDWEEKNTLHFVPAREDKSTGNAFSVFLFAGVKDPQNFADEIGTMALYFNAVNIRQSYKEYDKYVKGTLYVLDKQGELLFDSTGVYTLTDGFPLTELKDRGEGAFVRNNQVYNTCYSEEYGYIIVNTFPVKAVREDVKKLQISMLGVFALALLIAVFLNLISTKIFAKRLKPITDTMEQIKEGHLTSFPIQKKYDDEVGYIYTELLRMCASLDTYIQKEYVYRLRQKEMELYTLQAQIDPHFLYNTLEAIRMNLYVNGETQASKMIWILSDMFRNMMKKEAVVTNREELNYLHSYLELFRYRLGSRMKFEFDIDENVYRYATIKHILQPIVENALAHGIKDTGTEKNPSTIKITGRKENDDILFSVCDDGCGIDEKYLQQIREKLDHDELFHTSIGIYNVNNRLRIVYGYSYKLDIESEWGKGTKVVVRIKAMRKKELEEYVQIIDS